MNRLVSLRGIAAEQSTTELDRHWSRLVGEPFAARTKTGAIRRGTLEIIVETSAVLQQLQFRQQELLTAIQDQLPQYAIVKFRMRVGPIH